MRNKIILILWGIACMSFTGVSDKDLPKAEVETLKGERMDIREVMRDSVPVVLTFWSTTCKPCIQELDALTEVLDTWKKEFEFKVVAVSTDDSRAAARAKALAAGRGWPFTVVLDKNQNLKRAMDVNSIPTLFVVNREGKIVYSHTGYTPGSEIEVYEKLKSLKEDGIRKRMEEKESKGEKK